MSLRQIGSSVPFGALGQFATIRRPPNATHVAIYTYPSPNEEWPVPAGYGGRSHPLLRFNYHRNPPPNPNPLIPGPVTETIIGEIDFTTSTDLYGQPIRLPADCLAVTLEDGGATGSAVVVRGRAFWFEERAL